MAKITNVASARKRKDGNDPHTCYACHEDIAEGQSYSWCQPSRYSPRINWHSTCPTPPPSRLESNEKRAAAMAAFEEGYDDLSNLRDTDTATTTVDGEEVVFDPEAFVEEIKSVLGAIAENVREAGELWREAASNIEDGFGHPTSMSEEFEGYADDVEGVADEIDNIEPDEYDADQWDDVQQWLEATVDSAVDEMGSAEGNLP